MNIGDIVIKEGKFGAKSLKYRLTKQNKIGDIQLYWGLRAKFDRRLNTWVTFGQDRALLARDLRLFIEDDYRYLP